MTEAERTYNFSHKREKRERKHNPHRDKAQVTEIRVYGKNKKDFININGELKNNIGEVKGLRGKKVYIRYLEYEKERAYANLNFINGNIAKGKMFFYDENGKPTEQQTGTFEGGIIDNKGNFIYYQKHINGEEVESGELIEGEIIYYNEDGKKEYKLKGTFINGRFMKGEITFYDEDGDRIGEVKNNFLERLKGLQQERNNKMGEKV